MRKRQQAKRDPATAQAEFAADLRDRLEVADATYRRRNKDVAAAAQADPLPIQQAKNPAPGPQFLQIVAKPGSKSIRAQLLEGTYQPQPVNSGAEQAAAGGRGNPEPKLTRVAFRVSRLMEFCSERRAAESDRALRLRMADGDRQGAYRQRARRRRGSRSCARDRGHRRRRTRSSFRTTRGGIDAETIESVLDYTIRVSRARRIVSPTRGAQGNALKTILAMGFVLDRRDGGDRAGVTTIEARGVEHRIEFRVDHINNQPKIVHTTAPSPVVVGTRFTLSLAASRRLLAKRGGPVPAARSGLRVVQSASHACAGPGSAKSSSTRRRPIPTGTSGRPRNPTSPHWYDEARLQRYLAAHVARDRDLGQRRTVREFIAEFRGLSGTAFSARS